MARVLLYLRWVESKREWHLEDLNGNFVYELRNCKNMQRIFDDPEQGERAMYLIEIKKYANK